MHRHPHFDLQLHDEDELAVHVGQPVVERDTLHEWPLSCVQRIRVAGGQSWVYKVQAQPTVEPAFYARARSPLLARARALPVHGAPPALLLEDLDAPSLDGCQLAPAEALETVACLLDGIAAIAGDPPVLADIRGSGRWLAHAAQIADDLSALVEEGRFVKVDAALIAALEDKARAPAVCEAISGPCGLVHTDLWGENVFVVDGSYRVIDWQRPIRGPIALDQATMLESLGIDSTQYVDSGILELRDLLTIGWLAACARRWFTAGAEGYDRRIAELVRERLLA